MHSTSPLQDLLLYYYLVPRTTSYSSVTCVRRIDIVFSAVMVRTRKVYSFRHIASEIWHETGKYNLQVVVAMSYDHQSECQRIASTGSYCPLLISL